MHNLSYLMSFSINRNHFVSLIFISCSFFQCALGYELCLLFGCIMRINIELLALSFGSFAYVSEVLFCFKLWLRVYVKGVNRNVFAYYLL